MSDFQMIINNPEGGNFLRRIEWNKEHFKAQIQEIADRYTGELQISTPEDKKKAKEDRTFLNAVKNQIDTRRKEIKAAIMEPYNIFEAELNESKAELDKVAASIDSQIKDFEDREKKEKIKQIREYWENHPSRPQSQGPLAQLTSWDRIQNPKWGQASCTFKKAKEEIDKAFSEAISNLQSIEQIDDERTIKNIMIDTLVKTGSLRDAYDTQARIHQQEKARKEQEERAEQARREAEQQQARARREAEEAERQKKTQAAAAGGIEALRARLAAQEAPQKAGGTSNAESIENAATAAQGVEKMPAEGNVRERGPVDDPADSSATCNDAQGSAGQAPGRAQEEKILKASFWVSGTKQQLQELANYIQTHNFAGYGNIK